MNPVIDNIKNRRSIRRYSDKKVSKKIIKELIEIGKYAPSSHNRQPWSFTVVNDQMVDSLSLDIKKWYNSVTKLSFPLSFIKEVKKSVDEMTKRVKSERDLFFYHAPCVIVIHAPNKKFFLQDCSCAAQNIMLAARSLGVGSCWIGFADIVFNNNPLLKKKLKIPISHKVMATIALGYPVRFPESALPRKESKVEWV
jgi:nitroreductase